MAYTEPVLSKRIDPDPAKRKTVWYDQYVATGGYAQLRKALGDDADNPRYVETVARRGYRFIGPVVVDGAATTAVVSPPLPAPPASRPKPS